MKRDEAGAGGRGEGVCVYVSGGRLVISIGVDVLASAADNSPAFERDDGDFDKPPKYRVTDADVFAAEIALALQDEREDGSTPIHLLLDAAFQAATDDGCDGVDYGDDDARAALGLGENNEHE